MGAHYTGATMGMSYASHSIRMWPALILMAILTILGATFASHNVELNVGQNIVGSTQVTVTAAIIIVATAFFLTTILTYVKIPSSTIQILVFAVVGVALAYNLPIHWSLIGWLVVTWAIAPLAACALGYLLTHVIDRFSANTTVGLARGESQGGSNVKEKEVKSKLLTLSKTLVLFGAAASFTMGANDVSNATGVFLLTHLFGEVAGLLGGIGLAVGHLHGANHSSRGSPSTLLNSISQWRAQHSLHRQLSSSCEWFCSGTSLR